MGRGVPALGVPTVYFLLFPCLSRALKRAAGSKGRVQCPEVSTINTAQDWTAALKTHLLYTHTKSTPPPQSVSKLIFN